MRNRTPAEVSGGTLSTAISMASHVEPQQRQTIMYKSAVTNGDP